MQGAVLERYQFRKDRSRRKIRELHTLRPRLSVSRTLSHTYAQIIDDAQGRTLVAASTLSPELRGKMKTGANIAAAEAVGTLIGQKAKAKNISTVVFDRGGRIYHGRVKALAEAARKAGLQF
jgi:large subunit ribosomal protein L18